MRPHFLPYVRGNPYQLKLANALRQESVEVQIEDDLKALVRKFRRSDQRPELIHLHWLPNVGQTPRRISQWVAFERRISFLRRRGVPLVWTAHNLVPHESRTPILDLWLTRRVVKMADGIICHSVAARDEILERLQPDDVSKLKVIPHGNYIGCYPDDRAEAACRGQLELGSDDFVYLFLGQIRPYKGVLELVDAFRRLPGPRARLVLAGRTLDAGTTELVQHRIAGDDRIVFRPGFVADADIQVYLKAADVVVFPYHRSLTSGALVLAMSFGRAAIAARHPGTVDTLGERGGLLYDSNSASGLFNALQAALETRQALLRIGAANHERALTWDWGSIAKATASLYREVTAKVRVGA